MPAVNITGPHAPYDLTNVTSVDNILEFIQEVNILSGEWFMTGILFAGFVILFAASKGTNVEPKEALIASSFIIAVLAIFFRALEFISTAKLVIILIAFGIIFVFTTMRKT